MKRNGIYLFFLFLLPLKNKNQKLKVKCVCLFMLFHIFDFNKKTIENMKLEYEKNKKTQERFLININNTNLIKD